MEQKIQLKVFRLVSLAKWLPVVLWYKHHRFQISVKAFPNQMPIRYLGLQLASGIAAHLCWLELMEIIDKHILRASWSISLKLTENHDLGHGGILIQSKRHLHFGKHY